MAELCGFIFRFHGEIASANDCIKTGLYRGSNYSTDMPERYGVMLVVEAWGYYGQLLFGFQNSLYYRVTDNIDKWPEWVKA